MLDRIARALHGTPVVAAYLFGSRQCGRALPDSDTDVAVLLPRGTEASLALLGELTVRLAEAGVPAPEVHVLNQASLAFQFEALRGARAFSADEGERTDYEAWVTLRYLDFEPLLALQYRIQRRRLAEEEPLVVRAVADRKLTQLDAFLGFLEKLGSQPADAFLADFVACGAARYYLQAAIECCADIGAHLIATDTKRRAEDYRSIFRILGEEGVIAVDVAAAMEPAASLRNRLVHAYDQVDDRRVHEMLRSSLPVLRSFGKAVATYLERVDHAPP